MLVRSVQVRGGDQPFTAGVATEHTVFAGYRQLVLSMEKKKKRRRRV